MYTYETYFYPKCTCTGRNAYFHGVFQRADGGTDAEPVAVVHYDKGGELKEVPLEWVVIGDWDDDQKTEGER